MISCRNQPSKTPKIDAKRIVQEYLDSKYAALSPVVTEVSEIDSMYTTFENLMSLMLEYSDLSLSISELYAPLAEAKTIKEIKDIQKKAYEYKAEAEALDSLTRKVMLLCDHPEFTTMGKNRRAIKAKYTADGREGEAYFFLESDEDKIGHTSIDNYNSLKKVFECQSRFDDMFRDFK